MEKRTPILPAGGNDSVGVEAAVGPHCELSPDPAVANPAHRFTQEVRRAAGGVGAALAQTGHQHVAGSGGHGQQRVIVPLAGVAMVSRALLVQSIGLADGRIQVDGQRRIAGSGHSACPCACQQLAAHAVELTDVAPAEAAQEGAQSLPSRWRGLEGALSRETQGAGRPPGAQRIRVVDAVAARQRGSRPASESLSPVIGPPRRAAEVEVTVDEFPQDPGAEARVAGRSRPALATRRWSSKAMRMPVGVVAWQHLVS